MATPNKKRFTKDSGVRPEFPVLKQSKEQARYKNSKFLDWFLRPIEEGAKHGPPLLLLPCKSKMG